MPERELTDDELLAVEDAATERDATDDELAEIEAAASAPQADAPMPTPQQPARAPPDPGFWTNLGRQWGAGFWKQGSDELLGARERLVQDALPGARVKMPDGTMRPVESGADMYRAGRDTERQTLAGGSEHHPVTSFFANMAGDLGSDFVLSRLGIPVTSPAYQALSGAASGLMGSDAELTEGKATPASGASAAASTALGGTLGYFAPKVGERVAKALPGLMSRAREGLENLAITQGRRVLLNGADALAGNKELRADAVREALESGAIRPLGTTQGAYARLEELASERGGAYAAILERLQALGVQGPEVEAIARELLDKADDSWRNSGADKAVANLYSAEADNVRNVAPRDFVLLGESAQAATPSRTTAAAAPIAGPRAKDPVTGRYLPRSAEPPPSAVPDEPLYTPPAWTDPEKLTSVPYAAPVPGPQGSRLVLEQAERMKRDLQDRARWERLRMTGTDEAKQEVSQVYRGAIEDAIQEAGEAAPKGSEVAQLAEEFKPVKAQLSRTIAARDAAERGTAAAAKRRGFSLTDNIMAAGAMASGGPAQALLAGAGNNLLRNRGTSTAASGAYNLSRAAGAVGGLAATEPETARTLAEVGAGLMSRQVTTSDLVQRMLGSNPDAASKYGPMLSSAQAQGPDALAQAHYVLSQTDPEYAAQVQRAAQAGQQ